MEKSWVFSHWLIFFPNGRLADFVHVPAIEALDEFVAGAVNAFEGGPNRALGTKEKKFAEMAEHGEDSHEREKGRGPRRRRSSPGR